MNVFSSRTPFERFYALPPMGASVAEWTEGDSVTPIVPTDHPEDPIGTVVMITANGGVMVKFPMAGAEVHSPDELAAAQEENG